VTPDSSLFLDAKSYLGAVRSDLDVDGTREPDDDAPTVSLRTNQGAICVFPAESAEFTGADPAEKRAARTQGPFPR
jgi:hypothetical protein